MAVSFYTKHGTGRRETAKPESEDRALPGRKDCTCERRPERQETPEWRHSIMAVLKGQRSTLANGAAARKTPLEVSRTSNDDRRAVHLQVNSISDLAPLSIMTLRSLTQILPQHDDSIRAVANNERFSYGT